MKKINPIYLLIALNIVLILLRDVFLSAETQAALVGWVENTAIQLGMFGYVGIVLAYIVCGLFFVPILIPLNIFGGAVYGAYIGTAIALIGITFSCFASIVSARHLFTGMQRTIDNRPGLKRLIDVADRHPNLAIVMVRFVVVLPYLVQNIALAATKSSALRVTLITTVSAIPGAAIYSFLGAGLVQAEDVTELMLYLTVPILLMLAITGAMFYFKSRFAGADASEVVMEE